MNRDVLALMFLCGFLILFGLLTWWRTFKAGGGGTSASDTGGWGYGGSERDSGSDGSADGGGDGGGD